MEHSSGFTGFCCSLGVSGGRLAGMSNMPRMGTNIYILLPDAETKDVRSPSSSSRAACPPQRPPSNQPSTLPRPSSTPTRPRLRSGTASERNKVNLGTHSHKRRLHRSSCIFNLKNLGFNMIKNPLPMHLIDNNNDDEYPIQSIQFTNEMK